MSKKGCLSDTFDHEMDHRDEHKSLIAFDGSFVGLGQAAGAVEPAEGPFDDPSLGLNLKDVSRSRENFNEPTPLFLGPLDQRAIRLVGPDDLGEFDLVVEGFKRQSTAIAVLHASGRNDQCPEQPERVHDHVPFAADDLFFPRRSRVARLVRSS